MVNRDEQYNDFKDNASCLAPAWACEGEGVIAKGGSIGRPCSGVEGANDDKGSNFWLRSDKLDPICNLQDSRISSRELGFSENAMNGNAYYRFDDLQTDKHNYRIASGYEPGVNDLFTGRDLNGNINLECYDGKLLGGLQEMVSDRIPTDELNRSKEPIYFFDPTERAHDLTDNYKDLIGMPNGPDKEQGLSVLNQEANQTINMINNSQDYLNNRISDHEQTMRENPVGSLEHNRALENKNWCENYRNELEDSKNKLQGMCDNINNNSEKGKVGSQNPTKVIDGDAPNLSTLDSKEKIDKDRNKSLENLSDVDKAINPIDKDGFKL